MNALEKVARGETVIESEYHSDMIKKHEAEIKELRQMIEYMDARIIDLERTAPP